MIKSHLIPIRNKQGRLLYYAVPSINSPDRFFWKVRKTKKCWLWQGGKNRAGYGLYRKKLAHRYMWELEIGKIPQGLLVLHRCDVPRCVKLEHLFLGTYKDNMQDASKKGRLDYPNGKNIVN